ncbi:hypothetical protein [Nonomuraea ceibae]|uniref:hypothetical protein n=1 Tax=Nonomuraea ceibae TaxID=1935170 RepID=UPI001C5E71FC|nr:hypothetical protein [Nonomuraea ceibae]
MPKIRGNPVSLASASYRLITGKSEASEPKSTQERTKLVLEALQEGGLTRTQAKQTLAGEAGVGVRTVERWAAGTQEAKDTARGAHASALGSAVRAVRTPASRVQSIRDAATRAPSDPASAVTPAGGEDFSQEARDAAGRASRLANDDNGLTITGDVTVSQSTQEGRTLKLGRWLPEGSLDHLPDVFRTGGAEAVAAEINRLIGQHYVAGMTVSNVTEIYFHTYET